MRFLEGVEDDILASAGGRSVFVWQQARFWCYWLTAAGRELSAAGSEGSLVCRRQQRDGRKAGLNSSDFPFGSCPSSLLPLPSPRPSPILPMGQLPSLRSRETAVGTGLLLSFNCRGHAWGPELLLIRSTLLSARSHPSIASRHMSVSSSAWRAIPGSALPSPQRARDHIALSSNLLLIEIIMPYANALFFWSRRCPSVISFFSFWVFHLRTFASA